MERLIALACSGALLSLACEANLTSSPTEQQAAKGTFGGEAGQESQAPVIVEKPLLPGFSVIRRLNRLEYQNTIEDLLGTQLDIKSGLPADNLGGEFSTIGAALSLSPLSVLAYEDAAYRLVDELMASDTPESQAMLNCTSGDIEVGTNEEAEDCAREILEGITTRAFRRQATTNDIDTLLAPFQTGISLGATRAESLRASLAAVLISPHFIFRVETDEAPDSGQVRPLTSAEVASRLSYALWATMPDQLLLDRALRDDLQSKAAIEEEVSRMLADERAEGFLENFAAAWLGYAHLDDHEVEPAAFPDFTPELAHAMMTEADRFVGHFLQSEDPVSTMLAAEFTFLNEALGQHYGISASGTPGEFSRVSTAGHPRRGLLTLGALLTHTSLSTRTSPVRRGEFVFARLLCGEIPPPPPGVEGFESDVEGLSMRERLEIHRQDPSCNSCHQVMDPLGLGLEEYDAVGAFRTLEGGNPIDASGELPDGRSFAGGLDLASTLAADPRFSECVTQKFMSYALGRTITHRDDWLAYLNQEMPSEEPSLSTIVGQVLSSDAFLHRQAGTAAP